MLKQELDPIIYSLACIEGSYMASDVEEWEQLSVLFAGLANPARVAIIEGIRHGEAMPSVADQVGLSRSGIQKHLDTLIETGLVYRPPTRKQTYALTPLGDFFAISLEQFGDDLIAAVIAIDEAEQEAREELTGMPVSEDTRERAIAERKWELVQDELKTILQDQIDSLVDT